MADQGDVRMLENEPLASAARLVETDRLVVRSRLLQATYAAGVCCVTALAGLIAAFAVSGPVSLAVLCLTLLVVVAAGYRSFRIELSIDDRGVVITNFLRSYALKWQEIGDVWIGVESVGFALLPVVSFARRTNSKPISSQATALSKRQREHIIRAIRPYAEHWHIRVHD